MPSDPRRLIARIEADARVPAGTDERFTGYGVMGLPFRSGHVLAMRRFPASSVGPAYNSVWHRRPDGEWVFYADAPPNLSCTRYFGSDAHDAVQTDVRVEWPAPFHLRVTMPELRFEWDAIAAPTAATRLMNAAGSILPDSAWRRHGVLNLMSMMAGPLLGVGKIGLHGIVPNGQSFIANPRVLWAIKQSTARMGDVEFGEPGPVAPQARLADFWIPQRGILAIGQAYFDPFDAARHSAATSRTDGRVTGRTGGTEGTAVGSVG